MISGKQYMKLLNNIWSVINYIWSLINTIWRVINNLWEIFLVINNLWSVINSIWRVINNIWIQSRIWRSWTYEFHCLVFMNIWIFFFFFSVSIGKWFKTKLKQGRKPRTFVWKIKFYLKKDSYASNNCTGCLNVKCQK